MATTNDLSDAIDGVSAAAAAAQGLNSNLAATSAQLTAAGTAIATASSSVNNLITALNNDPGLVESRARAAARVALGPAIQAALQLVKTANKQLDQFRSEGVA